MALEDKKQPIVVKKIKKHGGGHHGGSWKVAYADFVTAMMAFFLLMWLLGSTTRIEREGISEYFKNPAGINGPGGASTSMIKLGGALELPKGEGEPLRGKDTPSKHTSSAPNKELIQDKKRLDELMQRLKEQIENSPALRDFKDQLLIDITSEGLRIQIVDKKGRPMFDVGSSHLKWYTKNILDEIAVTINEVPNHVSITGHTDARRYSSASADYTNWELSADRANAARRELLKGGLAKKKFGRVVGLASSVLFDKQDPYNPINRRISIIVLNKATEKAIGLDRSKGKDAPADAAKPASPAQSPTKPQPVAPAVPEGKTAAKEGAPGAAPAAADPLSQAIEGVLGPPPAQ